LKAGSISATSPPREIAGFTNCLWHGSIVYVGDLVMRSEKQVMLTPNFGRKSRDQDAAGRVGLHLRMEGPGLASGQHGREVRRYVNAH
jgi:DNA-directed RNA polymerase alpha subunit